MFLIGCTALLDIFCILAHYKCPIIIIIIKFLGTSNSFTITALPRFRVHDFVSTLSVEIFRIIMCALLFMFACRCEVRNRTRKAQLSPWKSAVAIISSCLGSANRIDNVIIGVMITVLRSSTQTRPYTPDARDAAGSTNQTHFTRAVKITTL